MALKTTIAAGIQAEKTGVSDIGDARHTVPMDGDFVLQNGVAVGQADQEFTDQRPLGAGANEDLDLAGGVTNALGETVTFARVKAIWIEADLANDGNIVVGAAALNAFVGPFGAATHTIALDAGERVCITNKGVGWTVTPGTGDLLRVANSGAAAANYKIKIIGTTT